MATGSDAGCPAEYTAGTMTADWLCITEPDIYIPQNIRLMAFLMSFSRWLRSATSSPITETGTLAISVVIMRQLSSPAG
ncbi:hypothetical protein ECZU23_53050 [Escherichia coli]|nr:hypothetical protein ECZU23_53050 [Escherichia coli]